MIRSNLIAAVGHSYARSAAIFNDDGINSGQMKQVPQHQACRACANYSDLCTRCVHGDNFITEEISSPCTLCLCGAPGSESRAADKVGSLVGAAGSFVTRDERILAQWPRSRRAASSPTSAGPE